MSSPTSPQSALDGIAQALFRARARQSVLSTKTDELNKVLLAAQEAIASLRLGVRAEVVLYPSDQTDGYHYRHLVFSKGKEWGLSIEWGRLNDPFAESCPVINGSREDRLGSIEALPRLLDAVLAGVDHEIERVEQQTAKGAEFIATVNAAAAQAAENAAAGAVAANQIVSALGEKSKAPNATEPKMKEPAKFSGPFADFLGISGAPVMVPSAQQDEAFVAALQKQRAREAIEKGNKDIAATAAKHSRVKK